MIFQLPFEMTNFVLSVDSFYAPMLTITDKRDGIVYHSHFASISTRCDTWLRACFDGLECPFTGEDAEEFYLLAQFQYPTPDTMLWHYAQDIAYRFMRNKHISELLK